MSGGDRITEVAVVEVRNGVATTLVDTLVNPQRGIPPWISGLTNISADMVRSAPVFAEICDQLLGALDGRVFVAHTQTSTGAFSTWRSSALPDARSPDAGSAPCDS